MKSRPLNATLAFVLSLPSLLLSAESVSVVSNVNDITAGFSVTSGAGSDVAISVDVPAIAVNAVTLDDGEYQTVTLPTSDRLFAAEETKDGMPAIPMLSSLLAIPDAAGVELEVSYSGFDIIEDIDLAPVQPPTPESSPADIPFTIDEAAYSRDEFYPNELAFAGEPAIMRDVRLVQVVMQPVQYNPVRRQLKVYRDLNVQVNYTYGPDVPNTKAVQHRYLSDGFYPIYKNMIANFEEMFTTAEVRRGGLMIITQPMYYDSLRAVANWKHRKGYTVRLVSTGEIDPTDHNPSTQQVFNYIRTAYESWEVPPEYVMIVGDKDLLPTSGVIDYPYESYASDNHYGCVEGTDFIPDIFIARMSVDSPTELRKAISKIFKYERNPQMFDSEHWIRGLSVGYIWTGFQSPRLTTLWVRQLQLQHGFIRVDTVYGSSDPNQRIRAYLNDGRAMTQYRGEGGVDGWWGPSFYISDLNALQSNQKLGVMAVLTCGTGNFGGECLGEEWLVAGVNPDSLKGGPAYYGVSDGLTHTKWNNPIMVGYYWGIFGENNYHFASAAVRGKMQQYVTFPRERNPGGWVEQYFHTYNMLGDPELELRTAIPKYLIVTHEETVAFGPNHFEVNVTYNDSTPVAGAFVTLIKGPDSTEEVFSVAKTDAAGNAVLYFDAATIGPMALTVSGQNLYPYLADIEIVDSDIAVGMDSIFIDDDASGYSSGNADSLASPNETIELILALKNFGIATTATDVTANLETLDEHLVVYDSRRSFGDIAPGQAVVGAQPFVVYISPQAIDGDVHRLKLNVTDQNNDVWYSLIEMPVAAPRFVVTRISVSDENNRLDQADTADVTISITNRGAVDAAGVSGYVTTSDDYATVLAGVCSFGDIPVGDSASNSGLPLTISAPAEIFEGHTTNFLLHTTTASGAQMIVPFNVIVGQAATNDPTGPDAYGYYIYDYRDSAYVEVPVYNWIDTAPRQGGQGTRLNINPTDDKSVLIDLPFDFIYYGQPHRHMIVSTNGFVATDTFRMDMGGNYWANFFNWPIPDPGNAAGQISPFWDDLRLQTGTSKGIYTWHDTTNGRFVIEFDSLQNVNGNAIEWFEVIITDPAEHPTMTGDSDILFQYRIFNNSSDYEENYSTIGFEDPSETIGLQYSYDNQYATTASTLANQRVIKITTNTGRGGVAGTVTFEGGSPAAGAEVVASTGQHRQTADDGTYWIKNVPPDTVDIVVELPGYFPAGVPGVIVTADMTTRNVDVTLVACPTPSALTATDSLGDRVEIVWNAVSHADLLGYNIYRARWESGEYARLNTSPISVTSYTDTSLPDSGIYWYCVTAAYSAGVDTVESFVSNKDAGSLYYVISGVDEDNSAIPAVFFLADNYPNPFNPSTTISFGLPRDTSVRLEVFNLLGQKIRVLLSGPQQAGYKQVIWDGKNATGQPVSSGVYFYRLTTGDGSFEQTKKMLMVK